MPSLGLHAAPVLASCAPGFAQRRANRRSHGFTLVEVVIAAGLIGFLAITATYFWVDSFGLVRMVNTDSAAIADGRALMERLAREIREVKYDRDNGTYCVSTLATAQMVFNKTSGTAVSACGGASPTAANNDIAVTIQLPTNSTTLNLGYAGTLAAPAATRALTGNASALAMRYLDAGFVEINSALPIATKAIAIRAVELTVTLQPTNGQATQTRTVVALRNN